jgi:hypothetical protein
VSGGAKRDLPNLVLGLAVGAGVLGPLLGGGRLLLLDWSIGPHLALVSPGAYGLQGGLTTGTPFGVAVGLLAGAVGSAVTWIPLALFFPLAAVAAGRLAGGNAVSRLGAGALYCANPWVFDRIYAGHVGLLLGYALLPLATVSVLRAPDRGGVQRLAPALWWAVLTALSPHFAWIYGVVVVAVALVHLLRRHRPAGLWCLVGSVGAFAVMTTYVLLPRTETTLPIQVGAGSLSTYRTSGDPHVGLFVNVLGLYGFWRPVPRQPKDWVSGWPILLLALLVVCAVGAYTAWRRAAPVDGRAEEPPSDAGGRRHVAGVLLVAGVAGYFLALGDQGPTGPLFRWAFFHVPFFAVMREPEKFLMLSALAYAVFFGWGVEHLVGAGRRLRPDWPTAGAVALAVVLPLAYTPTIFDGLAGQLAPSRLPASWAAADRLMGDGPGRILFLPWHLYMGFPFTGRRVIANPAPSSFRRSVISGDNVEAGGIETTSTSPRSAYLQHLYPRGPGLRHFGRLVAPLGVKYVVLADTADWSSYSWLASQADLVPVMDSGGLEVWRNAAYAGVGQATTSRPIRQISPVAYSIGPGPPGEVSLEAVYQQGWQLGTQKAQQTPEGTISFHVGPRGGVAQFTPWGITRLGYIISGASFVVLFGVVLGDRQCRRRRSRQGPGTLAPNAHGDS